MAGEKHSILGIGAAILDHILYVDDDFLSTIPGRKGGMEPIDITTFTDILRRYKSETKLIPGGSAANVIRGLSNLGHRCAFHCKVGQDKAADLFLEDLKRQNVLPISNKSKTETAQVLSLVTPDGQRTCRTFLGASVEMCGRDLHAEEFKDASLVHIEGYSLTRNNLVLEAMRQAKAAGAKISFDLASFEIVENYKDFIFELASNYVDVLLTNQDEAHVLTGASPEIACRELSKICPVVVVSMNTEGCWVGEQNSQWKCSAYPVTPVDTTGAGDLFASGFLHGYLTGKPLIKCAHYGALLGAAVVQIEGAELPESTWKELRKQTMS